MTKATDKRKCLFGTYSFQRVRVTDHLTERMAAGRHSDGGIAGRAPIETTMRQRAHWEWNRQRANCEQYGPLKPQSPP